MGGARVRACVAVCGCSGLEGGAERKLKAEFSLQLVSSMVGVVGVGESSCEQWQCESY